MKTLLFREILLASHKERRARKIKFHPHVTVIKGPNDTGKSSVVKALFQTFGADPTNIHPRWKEAEVSSLVKFSIDGRGYCIYRQGRSYSLFSDSGELIATYSSVTNELGLQLAQLCDFQLVLPNQDRQPTTPPPAFMFLPYYIDQDSGWKSNWSSFDRLRQFPAWRSSVVNFHTGIRPNRWYELKAEVRRKEKEREAPVVRERMLSETLKRLREQILRIRFDIDVEFYKREIDRLLVACDSLCQKEEEYRNKLVDLDSERIRLETQKAVVLHAKAELEADYEFATRLDEPEVECPTCGAAYSNSFAERFAIACDEDRCINLLQQIQEDLRAVEKQIHHHRQSLSDATAELRQVNSLLAEKQGEITLNDLIKNEGRREAARTLRNDLEEVQGEIAKIDAALREVNDEIAKFEDRKRSTRITKEYREWMRRSLAQLNVIALDEKSYRRIDCAIKESGSDLPRALLAYVFSILHVIKSHGVLMFLSIGH